MSEFKTKEPGQQNHGRLHRRPRPPGRKTLPAQPACEGRCGQQPAFSIFVLVGANMRLGGKRKSQMLPRTKQNTYRSKFSRGSVHGFCQGAEEAGDARERFHSLFFPDKAWQSRAVAAVTLSPGLEARRAAQASATAYAACFTLHSGGLPQPTRRDQNLRSSIVLPPIPPKVWPYHRRSRTIPVNGMAGSFHDSAGRLCTALPVVRLTSGALTPSRRIAGSCSSGGKRSCR